MAVTAPRPAAIAATMTTPIALVKAAAPLTAAALPWAAYSIAAATACLVAAISLIGWPAK